jgi:hypothetical protein
LELTAAMTRRSRIRDMRDLDVAGVIRVHAAQRVLAAQLRRPVCGWFSGFAGRHHVRLCDLDPHHGGAHRDQPDGSSLTSSVGAR